MSNAYPLRLATLLALVSALLLTLVPQMAKAAHPGSPGRVVFSSNRDGDNEIYTMGTDGTNVIQVTNNTYNDRMPSWGPGGEQIAFVSNRDGNDEIYLSNQDGSNVVRLTNNAAKDDSPTWSNNGETVAFVRQPTGEDSDIMSLSSREPEGMVLSVGTEGRSDTVVAPQQVTTNVANDERPSYAPNGALAFDREPVGVSGQDQIVVMTDTSTQAETVIAASGGGSEWDPDWAPDGSKLLYVKGKAAAAAIWQMNPDGTSRSLVVDNTGTDQRPAYWPGGNNIVYTRAESGNNEVYKKNLTNGNETNLTNNSADDSFSEVRPINETRSIPVVVQTEIPDTDTPTSHDATITFDERTSYKPADSYQCRIDGGAWGACISPIVYTGLSLGVEHTFEVKGTSGGVTETPSTTSWTTVDSVDSTPGLGLLPAARFFYGLNLDSVFGDLLGHDFAMLDEGDHQGSRADSGYCGGGGGYDGCLYDYGYLLHNGNRQQGGNPGTPDADLKSCNSSGGDGYKAYGWAKRPSGSWTLAVARRSGHCNTTFTNINHVKHYQEHPRWGGGSMSWHT